MATLIAITGGIGSGKSVVSRILAVIGMRVYDCDSRAKALMDDSDEIKGRIASEISPKCITTDNKIDRKVLSELVFNDASALEKLNHIVHGGVRVDLGRWRRRHADDKVLFVETAILYQSGLDAMVDMVWEVRASKAVRITRVMIRSHLTEAEVEARINSQDSHIPVDLHRSTLLINNSGDEALLPQVITALKDVI